jgi:hypothetical protein
MKLPTRPGVYQLCAAIYQQDCQQTVKHFDAAMYREDHEMIVVDSNYAGEDISKNTRFLGKNITRT